MGPVLAVVALLGMSRSMQVDQIAEIPREQIQVLPVPRTPESNSISLKIVSPKEKAVINGTPMWIQFRIEGYSLGSDSSQFPRADEIVVSDMGQTVHAVLDNEPAFSINEPALNPFNEEGYFRYASYKFEVPFDLEDGMHTIRVFPVRSFGESLKGENTLHAIVFYIGEKTPSYGIDLSQPYLTYNEPSERVMLTENKPILLDFLVTNCELSPDGYTVRLTIDEKLKRSLSSWQPYYIFGLSRGKHTVRLELIDPNGELADGSFNDIERTILVQ